MSSGRAEAADGLAGDEFGADFFFLVGVVFVEVAFNEGRLDGAGSDAVDAEFLGVVDGDLAGHGVDGAFAGAVGEALFDADRACDRADVARCSRGRRASSGKAAWVTRKTLLTLTSHDAVEVLFGGVG